MIDAHCHLDDEKLLPHLATILTDAKQVGVERIMAVSMEAKSAQQVLSLSREYSPMICPCAGLHPLVVAKATPEQRDVLLTDMLTFIHTNHSQLVAIGEIGLDYSPWLIGDDVPSGSKEAQIQAFQAQLDIAKQYDLPVNVHSRSAGHYAIDMIESTGVKALLHAFDGKIKYAKRAAAKGLFYFSVAPSINRDKQLQNLVKFLPLESLLLETDAPALAPERNTVNNPANLIISLQGIARIRELSEDKVQEVTYLNTQTLFPRLFPRISEELETKRNLHVSSINVNQSSSNQASSNQAYSI